MSICGISTDEADEEEDDDVPAVPDDFTPSAQSMNGADMSTAAAACIRTRLHIAKSVLHIFKPFLKLRDRLFDARLFFFEFRFRIVGARRV